MRWLLVCLWLLPLPALAQDQSLADIKAELGQLMADFNSLKAELVQSGAAASGAAGGDALQRMDAIEAELTRLTARAEDIEIRLNKVVTDGTARIADIEFRLCEQTEGCDPGALPETPVLGGETAAATPVVPAETSDAPELALGEKRDFDAAKTAYDGGDLQGSADRFAAFNAAYPGSPLAEEANYLRGEALTQLGQTADAARAYLDAFSSKPDGPFAPDALLKLGQALGALQQVPDACVTLAEVGNRFPGTIQATNAQVSMQGLGCQ